MAQGVSGIHVPALPAPDAEYDATRAEQTNLAIEQALQELSARLDQILTEGNLAALLDTLSEETSPEDTDQVLVNNGDGTLAYVEFGDLGGGGGGGRIPPPSGRYMIVNQNGLGAITNTQSMVNGTMWCVPFTVARSMTNATVNLRVTTKNTASLLGCGVYATNAVTGLPGALLFSNTSSSTGAQTLAATGDLEAGVVYWFACLLDTTGVGGGCIVQTLATTEVLELYGLGDSAIDTGAEDTLLSVTVATGWSDLPDPFAGSPTYSAAEVPAVYVGSP